MNSWYDNGRYCDGSSFAGNAVVTTSTGSKIHFKGQLIRDAVIRTLLRDHGMRNASHVVLSGCSAGALAVYLGIDHMADIIRHHSIRFGRVINMITISFLYEVGCLGAGHLWWSGGWQTAASSFHTLPPRVETTTTRPCEEFFCLRICPQARTRLVLHTTAVIVVVVVWWLPPCPPLLLSAEYPRMSGRGVTVRSPRTCTLISPLRLSLCTLSMIAGRPGMFWETAAMDLRWWSSVGS